MGRDRSALGAELALALALALNPSAGAAAEPSALGARSAAEVRAYHYQDSSGLLVGSYGGWLRHDLLRRTTIEARVLADYVRVDPSRGIDATAATADQRAPDAVTSASATAGGSAVARKWRLEGQLGGEVRGDLGQQPIAVGLFARASSETDYGSITLGGTGRIELAQRNTSLSFLIAHGRDQVRPVEVFRGAEAGWPAQHQRWAFSLAAAQILSPAALLTAGATATLQRGTLASPYRRVVIAPNLLLPEQLPGTRNRVTGYVGLSLAPTASLGVHLRQGVYLDSWSVRAWIPELTLAAEIDDGVLVEVSYRGYVQDGADFYQAVYAAPLPIMTGDLRLGPLRDHNLSLQLRRRLVGRGSFDLPLLAGYQVSLLDHQAISARVVAHVFMLGLAAEY